VKNQINGILLGTFLLSLLGSPCISLADSGQVVGGGSAQASISFRIVIPPSLFLQVQSSPLSTTQPALLSESTGEKMTVLDVRAYGNVPKKGVMHLSSQNRHSIDKESGYPDPNHHEYLWMPRGIVTIDGPGNETENGTLNISSPSSGIYTFHLSDKTNPPSASANEYQSFILCSP